MRGDAARLMAGLMLAGFISPVASGALEFPRVPSPNGSYELLYSVTISDAKSKLISKGSFLIAESGGVMLAQYTPSSGGRSSFYYNGKETFYATEKRQGYIDSGFHYESLQLPVYFPFSFVAERTYRPVSEILSRLPADRRSAVVKRFVDVNALLYLGSNQQWEGSYRAAKLQFDPVGGRSSFRVGIPGLEERVYEYSDLRPLRGVSVPGTVTVRLGELEPKNGALSVAQRTRIDAKLKSMREGSPYLEKTSLDSLMSPGMIVSYNGVRGNAGVVYDPSKGKFDDQLQDQLGARASGGWKVGDRKRSESGSAALVPILLSVVFGLAAVVFLLKGGRWKR